MKTTDSGSAAICQELAKLREAIERLTDAVTTRPSVEEFIVGVCLAGRLAHPAGPSAVAESVIPTLVKLAEMVIDHTRLSTMPQ